MVKVQQNQNGKWRSRVFGSSVIGPMHLQHEIPCQDACAYAVGCADTIVIVVADGLGSAAKSDTGASIAVTSAFRFCMTALESRSDEDLGFEEIIRSAAVYARQELKRHAREESCDIRDLGCTLIIAVASARDFAVAHIGDGAVVGEIDDILSIISGPGESEYTNEVVPLTNTAWQESLRITSREAVVRSIAVFTDGCQRAAFRKVDDALVPFERFFAPIFNYARQISDVACGSGEIAELLASAKLCEHSDDDKTLVIGVIEVD